MTTNNDTTTSKSAAELEHDNSTLIDESSKFKTTPVSVHPISKSVPFVVTIAISVALAILYTNLHLTKEADQLVSETQQLAQHQAILKTENKLALTSMEHDLNQRLTTINKTLESALQERWYQANDWILLKARYYLELASINAHWSNDLPTTSSLLKEADTLLATIQGERLSNVRQALAKEQTELLQITPIDITGILSQLDAIQHVINTLTPQKPLTAIAANSTPSTDNSTPHSWREHLKASLKKLDTLIIIRHQDDTLTPLLTPAYAAMLGENIRLSLQEAQWAVLQQNQGVYQLSLTQAIENINRVFDKSQTAAITTQLTTLQNIQLTQPKPVLGQSLQLLNDLIATAQPHSTSGDPEKGAEQSPVINTKPQNDAGASS